MLEPQYPDYSHDMYLKGFSQTQIYSAFKQTQRRKREEQSILEKETLAFVQAMLAVAVREAMDEIFKDWNSKTA